MSGPVSALFERLARRDAGPRGRAPAWLEDRRRAALQWVSERGFPTTRDDAWKHTRLGPILDVPFEPAERAIGHRVSSGAIDRLVGNLGAARLVFVNGYFAPQLSSPRPLPEGVEVRSLAAALVDEGDRLEPLLARPARARDHAFTALNAAFAEDGAFIRIPAHTTVPVPLHLVFLTDTGTSPLVSHPRSLVLAGAGSRATIVETYAGILGDVYLTNAVTEIVLDEGAEIEHHKIQIEQQTAFHVALLDVQQARDSRFTAHSIALGAAIGRHELSVGLQAEGAEATMNGLYMPQNEQQLDNPITIEHAAPRCTSRTLYKGVVDGRGRGVFDGRIVVRPGAFATAAHLTNRNLLLSASAQADTRPRLEIFADDVKCAHGATVGRLDDDELFYLRSRGIPLAAARRMLTYAFVSEMLGRVQVSPLRTRLERRLALRLHAGGLAEAA